MRCDVKTEKKKTRTKSDATRRNKNTKKNQYEEKTEQKIDARKTLQNINNLSVRTNK